MSGDRLSVDKKMLKCLVMSRELLCKHNQKNVDKIIDFCLVMSIILQVDVRRLFRMSLNKESFAHLGVYSSEIFTSQALA